MTTTINNEQKKLNVPNLRFKEFQGEWEVESIKDVADFMGGGTPSSSNESFWQGTIPWVSSSDIVENDIKNISISRYITEEAVAHSATKLCPAPSILIVSRVGVGKIALSKEAICTSQDFCNLVNIKVDPIFLTYCLSQIMKRKSMEVQGTSIKGITISEIQKISINIPSLQEQKKIGKILSLLDERIATQNKIIDKLQSLIKGIVDCTILRKEKNAIVGDVCSISEQIKAEANIDDIITVRLHGNGVCKSSAENLQLGATQYYRRRAGQLIYGKQNFHNGAIGIVPKSLDNGITSKDIPSFDIYDVNCNSAYLLAQLQSPQYYKPAEALTTGTGSKRLKEETFLKMPIVLPNKREQDNIAILIYRISINLDQAKKMLDLFSIQKQYLLRQMFI